MDANRTLLWSPAAKWDLRAIWRYYASVGSPELGDRIVRELTVAADALRRLPTPGRSRAEIRPGMRSLLVHPHAIFFRLEANAAQVVRVLHERRDFPTAFEDDER